MPPHQHTHEQQMRPPPAYLLPGIQHGLGITLQLFHVAKELLEEVLTGRLALQGQVHSQGLQDGTIVTQGGGVCQLGREPGELGQRQGRRRPAVTRRAGGCGYPARGRVRLPGVREDVVTRRAGGCGYPGVREGVVTPGVREGREGRGQPTRTIPSAHPARCYRPGRCRPPAWHPRCRRSLCH